MSAVRLDASTIDAIARRVADLLAEPSPLPLLLTAGEVAHRLGVSEEWVRQHADDLGAVRLSEGDRPRLRFDPAAVAERLNLRSGGTVSSASRSGSDAGGAAPRRGPGPFATRHKVPLLAAAVSGSRVKSSASPKTKAGRRRANGPPPTPRKDPSAPAERSPRRASRASDGGPPRSTKEER